MLCLVWTLQPSTPTSTPRIFHLSRMTLTHHWGRWTAPSGCSTWEVCAWPPLGAVRGSLCMAPSGYSTWEVCAQENIHQCRLYCPSCYGNRRKCSASISFLQVLAVSEFLCCWSAFWFSPVFITQLKIELSFSPVLPLPSEVLDGLWL